MLQPVVSFTSPDWLYIKSRLGEMMKNQADLLKNKDTSYKDTQIARGRIIAYEQILNLPQEAMTAANKR